MISNIVTDSRRGCIKKMKIYGRKPIALLQVQRETWTRIEDLLNQSLCLVNYIKSATV